MFLTNKNKKNKKALECLKCTPKVRQNLIFGGAFFMSKYSGELKLKAAKEYLEGKESYESIAKKYGVTETPLRQWVAQYKQNGKITKPTQQFSIEFKLKVLNYQQEHNLSDQQLSLCFNITNKGTIAAWRKKYLTGGTEALAQKRGRRSKVPKSRIPKKPREQWTEHEELEYLRMENDYLKKLYALIQEREQNERKEKMSKEPSEN